GDLGQVLRPLGPLPFDGGAVDVARTATAGPGGRGPLLGRGGRDLGGGPLPALEGLERLPDRSGPAQHGGDRQDTVHGPGGEISLDGLARLCRDGGAPRGSRAWSSRTAGRPQ